jgi:hypothetical protein
MTFIAITRIDLFANVNHCNTANLDGAVEK